MNSLSRSSFRSWEHGFALALVCLFSVPVFAELIPAAQLTDWTPGLRVGVIGGIPTTRTHIVDVTKAPYNADNTDATDATAAIQAAINGSSLGDVIYLPAGTYRINSTLYMAPGVSGRTLRGAGESSILDIRTGNGLLVGSGSGFSTWGLTDAQLTVTSGISKGSTQITVGSTAPFQVGQMLQLMVQNDPSIPVVNVLDYDVWTDQGSINQYVRLISKTATTLSFYPPLYDDYGAGTLQMRVQGTVAQVDSIGLENFVVDCTNYPTNGGTGVIFYNTYGCWVQGVNIQNAYNYDLILGGALNCEVRGCLIEGGKGSGSNGAGLLCSTWGCLIEDNIITQAAPLIEVNGGSSGNVFAFNCGGNGNMFDTNHSPHNRYNLYEGNTIPWIMSDGYFGGESELTIFRNYIYNSTAYLRRFTRRTAVVGNYVATALNLGLPNLGNNSYTGTAQLSKGQPWRDYNMTATLTTRTDNDNGVITLNSGALYPPDANNNVQLIRLTWAVSPSTQPTASKFVVVQAVNGNVVTLSPYPYGATTPFPAVGTAFNIGPGAYYGVLGGSYQEMDLDVAATLTAKGNYYMDTKVTDPLGGDTMKTSLFRSDTTPGFFGSLPWPPFDPTTQSGPVMTNIPAAYRYMNGTSVPPGSADQTPPSVPQGLTAVYGTAQVTLNWTASTDNVGVTSYRIVRSQGAGSTVFMPVGSATGTTFTDSGVLSQTVYSYMVQALDAAGNPSSFSGIASVTTSQGKIPTAPTGLKITSHK